MHPSRIRAHDQSELDLDSTLRWKLKIFWSLPISQFTLGDGIKCYPVGYHIISQQAVLENPPRILSHFNVGVPYPEKQLLKLALSSLPCGLGTFAYFSCQLLLPNF